MNSTVNFIGIKLYSTDIQSLISARKYTNSYTATRTNPFAEWGGDDRNEMGLYQGLKINRHYITIFGNIYPAGPGDGW